MNIFNIYRRTIFARFVYLIIALAIFDLGMSTILAAQVESISDQAAGEIAALMKEKASWTPTQQKLESQLIHASKQHRGEAFAPGVTNLQMGVKFETDGRIKVDINATVTPELLALIAQDGGTVINQFPQFHAIRALVSPAQLETLAASTDALKDKSFV